MEAVQTLAVRAASAARRALRPDDHDRRRDDHAYARIHIAIAIRPVRPANGGDHAPGNRRECERNHQLE
jgi:hypothetical protein